MGNTKARSGWGLDPLMVADPRKVRQPPRVANEVADPKEEEGEEKGRVMVVVVVMELMVGLFGGGCGF